MALAAWQATIVDESGNIQGEASVEVLLESSGALAALFSDRDGESPIDNPVEADPDGFVRFYAAGGAYRINATLGSFTRTWRHVPIGLLGERDTIDVVPLLAGEDLIAATISTVTQPYTDPISSFYAKHAITVHGYYGFLDESIINYAGGAPIYGHASFNDNVTFTGNVASDHHHSFQSYPHYDVSATITRIAGFYSIGDVTDGTVTSYAGVWVDDPTGTGTISNLYGIYIAPLDRGTGNSYAFFSEGQTKSCLGGDLQLGVPATPATVKYNYDNGNLEIIPRATYKVHVQAVLLIGTATEGTAATIENTGGGDLEISARETFNIKAKSPLQVEHPIKLPAYTVAQLGSDVLPGDWTDCICICSNETGGRTLVFSTGTNWKRVQDLANIS
jgi:hypothetical protein